jgi:hypothetical protein
LDKCSGKEKREHNVIDDKNGISLKVIIENENLESIAECAKE